MSGWRYIATRLNGDGTETLLHSDLPLQEPSIEDALSAPNGLSGTISPEIPSLKAIDGGPLLDEYGTAIYAELDGNIRGGGILIHSGFDGPKWSLECAGFVGYANEMPYTGNGAYWVKTDTLDIWREIWKHLQDQPGGDIGLTFGDTKSGVLVGSELTANEYDPAGGGGGLTLQSQAYKLAWHQDHDLSSNLSSLAADTPFDYVERHWWDGDTIRHHVDFGVPKIGSRRDDLRFVVGENILVRPTSERAGEDYADEVYALGAGEGASMIRGYARGERKRLRRVKVVSDPSMRELSRANNAAESELAWRRELDDITSVVVRDSPHAPIGSVNVGDEIPVSGKLGWVEVDDWFRVMARTITPGNASAMELTVRRSDRIG